MSRRTDFKLKSTLLAIAFALSMFASVHPTPASAWPLAANPTVTVLTPSGSNADVIGEGDEYFTQVLGDPRDMNDPSDLMWQEFGVTGISATNGIWTGTAANPAGNSRVWPLYPGYSFDPPMDSVAEIGKTGWNYPIQPSKYTQLSFRINSPTTDNYAVSYSTVSATVAASAITGKYTQGWQVYTQNMNWGPQPVTGIAFRFGFSTPATYQFDWIRLTDPSTSPVYTIKFSVADVQSGDLVDLTCSTSAQITNDNYCGVIASGIAVNSAGTYQYQWRTAYLPPGEYYVRAVVRRGGASDVSDGPLKIKAAPMMHIDAPSMSSGPDYATEYLGNPWDMADESDIRPDDWTRHDFELPCPCFNGGELDGVVGRFDTKDPATTSDPFVYLSFDRDHSIDTSKYKYFTFRYKVDRVPWWSHSGDRLAEDMARHVFPGGWVVRLVIRSADILGGLNVTNDIIVFDDWNTYTIDLSKGEQRGYWESAETQTGGYWTGGKKWIRFDFLEGVDPWMVHLTDVKLTGDDEANASYTIRWSQLAGEKLTSVNVFASQNQAACLTSGDLIYRWAINGQPGSTGTAGAAGTYKIFLPLIQRIEVAPTSITWTTANVPAGKYFVCMRVNDGFNTSTVVSEAPVAISH